MKILGQIPKEKFYLAFSGGMDSMVFLDFLSKYPHNDFELLFFHHNDVSCDEALEFSKEMSDKYDVKLNVGRISRPIAKDESKEEYWRNERYKFLESFNSPVLTAHHLDDVIETWVFSSLKGTSKLIPYRRNYVIRPLLLVSKQEIFAWCIKNNLKYINDKSNNDNSLDRNYIRNIMMPHVLRINPGIHKTIKKKILAEIRFDI